MKSRKIVLRAIEIMLGLSKIEDIVDYDIRGIIRGSLEQMEEEMKDSGMAKMMKEAPYEMKLAMMKFYENCVNLAEAEHGPYFTPKQLQDSVIKMLNGNPMNMMVMLGKDNISKN